VNVWSYRDPSDAILGTRANRPCSSPQSRPQPRRILARILTTTADWTRGIGPSLVSALAELDEPERLDIGCALEAGMFELAEDAPSATSSDQTLMLASRCLRCG
jgi:hypothetical protein